MWHFILLVWLIQVRGDPEVTTEPANTEPETTVGSTQETLLNSNQNNPEVRIINKLTGLYHGIKSGKVSLIGENTIRIPNFYFDGTAPEAYFLLGTGDTISDNGTRIPVNNYSETPLSSYNGQNVTLILPPNLNINDFDWLAVWCYAYSLNLGYVYLKEKLSPYPPQTLGLKNIVTSGPIVLVNKKTLFIPDIRYNGGHRNVHFWVGNGTKPNPEGIAIPDENNTINNLHAYQGQNIYIHLPDSITTDNIEYFGVWSSDEKRNLGHISLKEIDDVPEAVNSVLQSAPNGQFIMRIPKCCPIYSVITPTGCAERPLIDFIPKFDIYRHNETHFNNLSLNLDTIEFQPYNFALECHYGKYPLETGSEEFALLQNGSLLVKGQAISGILTQQHFCLENIEGDATMKIFVCAPEYKIQEAMFYTYITFTIISLLCFAGTFILYFFFMKVEDIHRKCFTAYIFAMAITFLSLTIVQIAHVENSGCEMLGFIFQIAMISSFTLLAILCVDIYIIVKYIDENRKKRKRKGFYVGVAVAVPVLSILISLARNLTPDVPNSFFKPQYLQNSCYFDAENQRTAYFYFPIIISIIVSIVSLTFTKLKIVQNDRELVNNYFWIEKGRTYKFMWRKHLIVFMTSLLWHIETLIHFYYADANILSAIDVIEASLGILVFLLFVANKETRMLISKTIKSRKKKKRKFISEEDDYMMKTLNGA